MCYCMLVPILVAQGIDKVNDLLQKAGQDVLLATLLVQQTYCCLMYVLWRFQKI